MNTSVIRLILALVATAGIVLSMSMPVANTIGR
jgi:hypothetical protein